jgi:hypothetical protein
LARVITIARRWVVRGEIFPLLLAAAQAACGSGNGESSGRKSDAGAAHDSGTVGDAGDAGDALASQGPCPQLSITLTSAEAPVGGEVEATVSLSPTSQATPSYTWTATDGEFLSSIAPSTRFSCSEVGIATLTVQVATPGCVETASATVDCEADVEDAAVSGACTSPGEVGCEPCNGSPGGLCTATEIDFVQQDLTGGCYACLLGAGCLDSPEAGLSGNECDDLVGNAASGPNAGAWKPSLCLMTISCILASSCADPLATNCYCGTAAGVACLTPGAANGACLTAETAGLETTDPQATVTPTFTSKSLAAGVANAIFVCAASAHCWSCLGPLVDGAYGDAGDAGVVDAGMVDAGVDAEAGSPD